MLFIAVFSRAPIADNVSALGWRRFGLGLSADVWAGFALDRRDSNLNDGVQANTPTAPAPAARKKPRGPCPQPNGGYAHGTDYNEGSLAVDQIREIFRDFPALRACGRRPSGGASFMLRQADAVAFQIR